MERRLKRLEAKQEVSDSRMASDTEEMEKSFQTPVFLFNHRFGVRIPKPEDKRDGRLFKGLKNVPKTPYSS